MSVITIWKHLHDPNMEGMDSPMIRRIYDISCIFYLFKYAYAEIPAWTSRFPVRT